MNREVPCLLSRAGTSRGAFFLRSDLPDDWGLVERVVLATYGSPDPRQIDGIGGGDPLTSKVAIVAPSDRPDADVDYTFGQVGIEEARVFWAGNCGNMSAGVAPFAIKRGLVAAVAPSTKVRIFNTNTKITFTAEVEVRSGEAVEEGPVRIAGVRGTGSPISLDFGDCGGAVTGKILPTGKVQERVRLGDGSSVSVSVVDAATPFVFVPASDVGMVGSESASEIDSNPNLLARLEEVRSFAARAIGLVRPGEKAKQASPSIPRVVAVGPPSDYVSSDGLTIRSSSMSVVARQLSMQRAHKTFAVTGAICTAVAGSIPGTVVSQVAGLRDESEFHIGHPGGIMSARVAVDLRDSVDVRIREASLIRTARVIMDGYLRVSTNIWPTQMSEPQDRRRRIIDDRKEGIAG